MSNVLSGKVVITAPGVQQTMAGVATSVGKAQTALKQMPATTSAATQSLVNLSRVAQDAPYGFIGIANNLNPLLESFQRLKLETGSTKGALKSLGQSLTGAGGIGLALGIVSSLAVVFGDKLFGAGKAAEKAKSATDALRDSISGVFKDIAKEAVEVGSLVTILKSETETRERRLSAIKELQQIQPDIFNGLKLEGEAVIGLDSAYTAYLANLKNVIAAKIIQARLEQKIEQLLRLQGAASTESEKALQQATKNIRAFLSKPLPGGDVNPLKGVYDKMDKDSKNTIENIQSDIDGLFKDLSQFSSAIKLPDVKAKTPTLKIKPDKIEIDRPALGSVQIELPTILDPEKVDKSKIGAAVEKLQNILNQSSNLVGKGFKLNLSPEALANQANLKAIQVQAAKLGEAFNAALAQAFQGGFEAVGEGIGNVLSGQDFGAGLISVFSELLSTIGKALIQYGIVKEGLDKILGPGGIIIPGALAIGLGVAAIAAAGALKNSVRGARADGGPVVGGQPYRVGERGEEIFVPNTGGQIIPNHQLGGRGNMRGSGMMGGQVVFKIAGKELIGVLSLAQQSQSRLV